MSMPPKELLFATIIGLMLWLAVAIHKPEPIPAIDLTHVATNKAQIEKCKNSHRNCVGGYVLFRGTMAVQRISNGKNEGAWTLDVIDLIHINGDAPLDRIQDIALPGEPRWKEFAERHAAQFVAAK